VTGVQTCALPIYTFGVYVRRFDSSGAPLGPDLPINTGPGANGGSIAANATGEFVVTWQEAEDDGYDSDVFARRYDNNGNPSSPTVPVNTYTTGWQTEQRVGIDAAGNFVVIWGSPGQDGSEEGVFGQRFDSSGGKVGNEFRVNTYTTGHQWSPSVSMSPLGDFVVVWSSQQPGSSYDILGQRYDAAGTPQGGELRINEDTSPGSRMVPQVASDASGNFVVTWIGQTVSDTTIVARQYQADGAPRADAIVVSADTTLFQTRPDVAVSPTGDFTIAWDGFTSYPSEASYIFARTFEASGRPTTGRFVLNTNSTLDQQMPSVARDHRGGFVIVWQCIEYPAPCSDGSSFSSVGRQAGVPAARPMQVDHAFTVRTDGSGSSYSNDVLEPGEQAGVVTSWTNNTGTDLALTGAASNFTGPAGPTYTLMDATADYGTIAADATTDCQTATGDCLIVSVSGTRPATHWDATFDEALSTGATKTWTLHVGESFPDVPAAHQFYIFIENLFHNEITGGCVGGNFCPDASVTRGQMAVFLLKAKHGSDYLPPPCTGTFDDVPCPSPFADWIEQLSAEAITGGCGGDNYCPGNPVTRAQMAVFLLKAERGSDYLPPDCAGIFGDVTCPSQFANWIEQLAEEQITGGCGGGNYCPSNPNTSGQIAVFLTKTFGLFLYGP